MNHFWSNLVDVKRCFIEGSYQKSAYDSTYMEKAETHALKEESQKELNRVADLVVFDEPKKILDLGCNTGRPLDYFLKRIKTKVPEAKGFGVDINEAAIRKATEDYPELNVEVYNGETLPFEDASVDHVMMHHVIGHVADPQKSLKEIYRVLAPGGTLSIITPNQRYKLWQFPFNLLKNFGPDTTVLRYYSLKQMSGQLKDKNFNIAIAETLGASPTACPSFLKKACLLRVFCLAKKAKA